MYHIYMYIIVFTHLCIEDYQINPGLMPILFPFFIYWAGLLSIVIVMIKHRNQKQPGRKSLFGLYFWDPSPWWRDFGLEVKAGTEAEVTEDCCLLVYPSWHPQPAFLHSSGWPAQERHSPFHFQENALTYLATGNLRKAVPQLKPPLPGYI